MKNNYKEKNILKLSSGFTLVEVLTAITIFGAIMIAVSGIFTNAIKQQKIILAKQSVADNALYAMEFMVKELRMAKEITTVNSNNSTVVFKNSENISTTYSLMDTDGDGNKEVVRNSGTGDQPISSDEIGICSLNFNVNDWGAADAPRITVFMKVVKGTCVSPQTSLEMQSTVSPRLY